MRIRQHFRFPCRREACSTSGYNGPKLFTCQISNDITRQNKTPLNKLNSKTRPKALWSVVRQLTGAKRDTAHVDTPVSPLTHNTRNPHTNLPVLLLLTSLFQN